MQTGAGSDADSPYGGAPAAVCHSSMGPAPAHGGKRGGGKRREGVESVSYTHLDVYKRQMEYTRFLTRERAVRSNGGLFRLGLGDLAECSTILRRIRILTQSAQELWDNRAVEKPHYGRRAAIRAFGWRSATTQAVSCLLYTSRCV